MAKHAAAMTRVDDRLGRVRYTDHGRTRSAQRNLSEFDLRYVMRFGHWSRGTGVDFIVLRRRDIPVEDMADPVVARLKGAVILLNDDRSIRTTYRNRLATRAIRKKHKGRWLSCADDSVTALIPGASMSTEGERLPVAA